MFAFEQRMHDVQAILDEAAPSGQCYSAFPKAARCPCPPPPPILNAPPHWSYGSYAIRFWATDHPFGSEGRTIATSVDDIEHDWGTRQSLSTAMWAPSIAGDRNAVERTAAYYRAAASPGAAAAIVKMNSDIDVRHVLPATGVRTLNLASDRGPCVRRRACTLYGWCTAGAKLMNLPAKTICTGLAMANQS